MASFRVACVQSRPRPDFESATAEALTLAERAVEAGADLIALPEYCGGLRSEGPALVPPVAPDARHPVLTEISKLAATKNVWILVGSVAVSGPNGLFHNRSYIIDDTGVVVARYDKLNMFDIKLSEELEFRESTWVAPGKEAVMAETGLGKIGMTVCYDLRFPSLYRDLARAGAEILAIPAAFTKTTGRDHWHVLNRARAIENGCFVVSPCATGSVPGGGECYGHSIVVDPWGRVLADGGTDPGIVCADIDLDLVRETRERIPSLWREATYRMAGAGRKAA